MSRLLRISAISVIVILLAGIVRVQHMTAQPVQNGYAAVTCFSDNNPSGPVVALIDVRDADAQPFNTHWPAPKSYGPGSSWVRSNLGEVFGIAFNNAGDIFVSATTVYSGTVAGGPGGPGAVYRLDGVTGSISTFVSTLDSACGPVVGTNTIPNKGSGLGNIAYDPVNNQFFVTNFEDGKIYRLNSSGVIQSTFDPFGADACVDGEAPVGERIWGIGVYNGRVYFARWVENCTLPSSSGANEIYSVALGGGGDFSGTESLEISVPPLPGEVHSNPVADIAFSQGGRMLLAERTMRGISNNPFYPNAHASRVLEYEFSGSWALTTNVFDIGTSGVGSSCGNYPTIGANAAGGVDYTYGSYNKQTNELINCDSAVWASGDALKFSGGTYVYGFQRLPGTGGNPGNSQLIDADGNTTIGDKTQIGDIEVYKRCADPQPGPCDSLSIRHKPVQGGGDLSCCFEFTINGVPAGQFSTISAELLTDSVTFTGVIGPSGWNVTNTGTYVTWDSAGMIPGGATITGLQFCLYSLVPPTQVVEFTFHGKDGRVCKDTIEFDCPEMPPPFPPCMLISDTAITCEETGPNGTVYDLSFSVTNQSPFSLPPYNLPAENLVAYSVTSGVNIVPGSTSIGPLGHGSTSSPLNFTVSGPNANPGDTVCFVLQLHGKKLEQDYQWCCPPDTLCVVLPPCKDCCDSVHIEGERGRIRQIGNGGASLSQNFNVLPGPVTDVSATILSVDRSDIWCPIYDPATGAWRYALSASGGSLFGQISSGGISPSLPLSYGISPPSSQVVWGTNPSGVPFTPGQIDLGMTFPGSSLGWRCRDTLTICVRYTFTDTACRTCDTVICYELPRRGKIEIIQNDPDIGAIKSRSGENPLYSGGLHTGSSALHEGRDNPGPDLDLVMTSSTAGTLSVAHWWQDDLEGDPEFDIESLDLVPEAGIEIVSLDKVGSGIVGTVRDRRASIDIDPGKGETDEVALTFDNPEDRSQFVIQTYVTLVSSDPTGRPTEHIVTGRVIARVPGESGGDIVDNDDVTERLVGVRTYQLYFVNDNALRKPIDRIEMSVDVPGVDGEQIIATGPPDNRGHRNSVEFTFKPERVEDAIVGGGGGDEEQRTIPANHNTTRSNKTVPVMPGDTVLPIYLTIAGVGDEAVNVTYTTYDDEGNIISEGEIELADPLNTMSVDDGDRATVAGSTARLFPLMPNPGTGDRTIRFSLVRQTDDVSVSLYDLNGRLIRTVIAGEQFAGGTHTLVFTPPHLASGTYYVVLEADGETLSTPMRVVE